MLVGLQQPDKTLYPFVALESNTLPMTRTHHHPYLYSLVEYEYTKQPMGWYILPTYFIYRNDPKFSDR